MKCWETSMGPSIGGIQCRMLCPHKHCWFGNGCYNYWLVHSMCRLFPKCNRLWKALSLTAYCHVNCYGDHGSNQSTKFSCKTLPYSTSVDYGVEIKHAISELTGCCWWWMVHNWAGCFDKVLPLSRWLWAVWLLNSTFHVWSPHW
jgi:hypothetical protein